MKKFTEIDQPTWTAFLNDLEEAVIGTARRYDLELPRFVVMILNDPQRFGFSTNVEKASLVEALRLTLGGFEEKKHQILQIRPAKGPEGEDNARDQH